VSGGRRRRAAPREAKSGTPDSRRQARRSGRAEPHEQALADEEEFPVIRRSYEPVADLEERLRRAFALLALPPSEDGKPEPEAGT
jgi:hypothetical protein